MTIEELMEVIELNPTYRYVLSMDVAEGGYAYVALEPLAEVEPFASAYDGYKIHYVYGTEDIGFDFSLYCEVGQRCKSSFGAFIDLAPPITIFDGGHTYCERITHDDLALWPGLEKFDYIVNQEGVK